MDTFTCQKQEVLSLNLSFEGPNESGCPCWSTEYGCCSDGLTPAQGPHGQGCENCEETPCCDDQRTLSEGQLSCDCSRSAYECCPDGTTPAAGPKFLGCDENPGDACTDIKAH